MHLYMFMTEYYSAIKNEILSFAVTGMDMEGIRLNEISQAEEDKYCMISFAHEIIIKRVFFSCNQSLCIPFGFNKEIHTFLEVEWVDYSHLCRLKGTASELQNWRVLSLLPVTFFLLYKTHNLPFRDYDLTCLYPHYEWI